MCPTLPAEAWQCSGGTSAALPLPPSDLSASCCRESPGLLSERAGLCRLGAQHLLVWRRRESLPGVRPAHIPLPFALGGMWECQVQTGGVAQQAQEGCTRVCRAPCHRTDFHLVSILPSPCMPVASHTLPAGPLSCLQDGEPPLCPAPVHFPACREPSCCPALTRDLTSS